MHGFSTASIHVRIRKCGNQRSLTLWPNAPTKAVASVLYSRRPSKRGLTAVGFDMRRVDQRPRKRESLAGVFTLETQRSKTPQPSEVRIFGPGLPVAQLLGNWLTKTSMLRCSIPKASALVVLGCRPAHCTVDCWGLQWRRRIPCSRLPPRSAGSHSLCERANYRRGAISLINR